MAAISAWQDQAGKGEVGEAPALNPVLCFDSQWLSADVPESSMKHGRLTYLWPQKVVVAAADDSAFLYNDRKHRDGFPSATRKGRRSNQPEPLHRFALGKQHASDLSALHRNGAFKEPSSSHEVRNFNGLSLHRGPHSLLLAQLFLVVLVDSVLSRRWEIRLGVGELVESGLWLTSGEQGGTCT